MVSVDPITGVSNAKSFSRYLKEEWRCAYSARQSLALMIIDLGIPSMLINDEKESDKIIRLACDEMKRFARRSGDLVGRYDNEKFAILLVNTDLENARKLAEKLLQLLQQTFEPIRAQHKTIDQHSKQVGINIGVASALPMPGIGSDDLVFRAEQALKGALKKNIAGK